MYVYSERERRIKANDSTFNNSFNYEVSSSHCYCKFSTECVSERIFQGDHMSGKPGNVREFETCQGNVSDVVNSQGIVREMSGKKSCHGKVSQNCSLLDEYLRSYGYLVYLNIKYTNMHSFYANTLNNNTIYLTHTPEVLATVYLNISISFKNSA